MQISLKTWNQYKNRLASIDKKAAEEMEAYIQRIGGFEDHAEEVIRYAYALASRYGEAAAAAACQMHEAVAEASGVRIPPAVPAEPPDYKEVARAVRGTVKNSSEKQIPRTVGRLVKRTGADTTLKNAERDGAQFAWIPMGDTCAFCLTLASRGWQHMSKNALKNGHAEHIHANCDCQYAIRFDDNTSIEGYDPDKYREMYENAEGGTPQEKINAMRREQRKDPAVREKLNAQKRAAYAERNKNKGILNQEDSAAKPPKEYEHNYNDFDELQLSEHERKSLEHLWTLSQENGFEYGMIIEEGVASEPKTNYDPNKVLIPDELITKDHTTILHCHTGNTPLSAVDLRRMTNEKVDKVGVVTDNKDVFTVALGDGWRPTVEEYNAIEKEIRENTDIDMMSQAMEYEWTPEELVYMCIREQLYRTALKFGWKVEGGLL